jgi:N-acetyl sugar amidotransferase
VKFCIKCVMPDTKPDLTFDERGVCDACRTFERKHGSAENSIDWAERKKEFESIIEEHKGKSPSGYDCLIPVSGGKDSTYQVYFIKEVCGLNPLCVTFEPTLPTRIGRKNLDMLNRLGVDLIHFKRNPIVYEKMVMEGFRRVGDNEWPNHLGIFTTPFHFAVRFKISLIIWGECPQMEYGGPTEARQAKTLDKRWLYDYGGLIGNRPEDMVSEKLGITLRDLSMYIWPSKEDLEEVGVRGIFLGAYFKWDVPKQLQIVKDLGWETKIDRVETTYEDYENIDCYSMHIHDYLKYVKYGFGRGTDDAVRDLRNHLIDRAQALRLVEAYDGKYPIESVRRFCTRFKLSQEEFDKICDEFTNKALFEMKDGKFVRDMDYSLVMKEKFRELRRNPVTQTTPVASIMPVTPVTQTTPATQDTSTPPVTSTMREGF